MIVASVSYSSSSSSMIMTLPAEFSKFHSLSSTRACWQRHWHPRSTLITHSCSSSSGGLAVSTSAAATSRCQGTATYIADFHNRTILLQSGPGAMDWFAQIPDGPLQKWTQQVVPDIIIALPEEYCICRTRNKQS